MLPLHYKAIAYSASVDPDAATEARFAAVARKIPDWPGLIRLSVKEETAGLLYKNLSRTGLLGRLDSGQQNTLRGWYLQTARENLLHIHSMRQILAAFEAKRVAAAMIKGMPLVHRVYEDVGLRKMADIDLWIPENHLPAALACLEKTGYRRDPVYSLKYHGSGITVDLHTHFLGADRIRTRRYLFDEEAAVTFHKAERVDFGHTPVRCLQDSDQVLFLWLHAAKHNLGKMIWLVDILNIVQRWHPGQWRKFAKRAEELKQTAGSSRLLFFLKAFFQFDAPRCKTLIPTAAPSAPLLRYFARRRIQNGALPFWAPLMLFSPGSGFSNHLRYAIERIFPRPDILREAFTGYRYRPNWPLYGLRSLQIACIVLKKALVAFSPSRGGQQKTRER